MPFRLPFNLPFFYNPQYKYTYNNTSNSIPYKTSNQKEEKTKQSEDSINTISVSNDESSDYFFEIFGLKLYFDDILIMCLLFFLYTEGVQDQELFLCLILLLIS